MDQLEKISPKLAEELVPTTISISILLKVLQNLLKEEVPVRDMRSIAEAVVNVHPKSQDPKVLTTVARQALRRMIVQSICGNDAEIPCYHVGSRPGTVIAKVCSAESTIRRSG